ncbi:hypothetical protein [Natrinema salinisoli]|uniref:hypothetical protein n=1 Tax=Natrinema salinisoli TaxID=2878535 RepID=UPI001CEFC8EA|nr:hypothetical protein [Natrinema salinisoli]
MDLTWLILEEEFVIVAVIWVPILVFAPIHHARDFWLGGALWLIASAGAAITEYGSSSDTLLMVGGQLLVYTLLSSIIFARDYTEPDSDLGAANRLIGIAAYLGKLTSDNTGPRRPQRQPRQPGHRQNNPNQQDQEHYGATPPPDEIPQNGNFEDLVDEIDDFRD